VNSRKQEKHIVPPVGIMRGEVAGGK